MSLNVKLTRRIVFWSYGGVVCDNLWRLNFGVNLEATKRRNLVHFLWQVMQKAKLLLEEMSTLLFFTSNPLWRNFFLPLLQEKWKMKGCLLPHLIKLLKCFFINPSFFHYLCDSTCNANLFHFFGVINCSRRWKAREEKMQWK